MRIRNPELPPDWPGDGETEQGRRRSEWVWGLGLSAQAAAGRRCAGPTREGPWLPPDLPLTLQHPCTWPGSSDVEWRQGQERVPLRVLAGPVLGPSRTVGWRFSPHSLGTLCLPLGTCCTGGSSRKRLARHTQRNEALHLQMTRVSTLVFLPAHRLTVQWLPWPWKSSKLLDARQGGTKRKPALLHHPSRHGQVQRPARLPHRHLELYLDLIKSAEPRTFRLRRAHSGPQKTGSE